MCTMHRHRGALAVGLEKASESQCCKESVYDARVSRCACSGPQVTHPCDQASEGLCCKERVFDARASRCFCSGPQVAHPCDQASGFVLQGKSVRCKGIKVRLQWASSDTSL